MRTKRLYKIWRVQHNKDNPYPEYPFSCIRVEFNAERRTWAYPVIEILDSFPRFDRRDVISTDLFHLHDVCSWFNFVAESDVHYEIREEIRED